MEEEALKIFLTSEQALWLERETGRLTPRLKSNPPSHVTTEPKGCRIKPRSNSKAISSLAEKEGPWMTLVVHLPSTYQAPGRISASAGEMQWQDRVPAPKKRTTQSRLGDLNLSGRPVKMAASRTNICEHRIPHIISRNRRFPNGKNLWTQANLPWPTRNGDKGS